MLARARDETSPEAGILTLYDGYYLLPEDGPPQCCLFWLSEGDVVLGQARHGTCLTGGTLVQVYDHSPAGHKTSKPVRDALLSPGQNPVRSQV
jgi:hypothetical protein